MNADNQNPRILIRVYLRSSAADCFFVVTIRLAMPRLQALFAILLLLFAAVQCVAVCTTTTSALPPCHRHHQPCATQVLAIDARSHVDLPLAILVSLEPAAPIVWRPMPETPAPSIQLDGAPPSLTILRI
jgi:hypothetical protein